MSYKGYTLTVKKNATMNSKRIASAMPVVVFVMSSSKNLLSVSPVRHSLAVAFDPAYPTLLEATAFNAGQVRHSPELLVFQLVDPIDDFVFRVHEFCSLRKRINL